VLQQAVEDVRQHFVGTVAEEHLIALHAVVRRPLLEQIAVRVRVQAQVVVQLARMAASALGDGP
jgi:hypothetical protein